jgi:hypothetical protein
MRNTVIIILLTFLFIDAYSQKNNDSIPMLYIYATLNGHHSGEHNTDWVKNQNCLNLEIDTLMVPANKDEYLAFHLTKWKKQNKKNKRDKEAIQSITEIYKKEYNWYKPLDTYDKFINAEIIGFKLSGSRCCFNTSAYSKSNCLSEDQIKYLDCLLKDDWIWIDEIHVKTVDGIYFFGTRTQFEIIE